MGPSSPVPPAARAEATLGAWQTKVRTSSLWTTAGISTRPKYSLATPEDLGETKKLVEKTDRPIVTAHADVRVRSELAAALDQGVTELGSLDIVLANAGVVNYSAAESISETAWNDVLAINLSGVFWTAQVAIPHLKQSDRGGAIVLTGSSTSELAQPNVAHYVATKYGVVGLIKSLSNELGPFDIRVNAVLPTAVRTQ